MKTRANKKRMFIDVIRTIYIVVLSCTLNKTVGQISIIPRPASIEILSVGDSFVLSSNTVMVAQQNSVQPSIDFFNNYLQRIYGFSTAHKNKQSGNSVILLKVEKKPHNIAGAYELQVSKEKITINAVDDTGMFYGIQTLIQLLPTTRIPSVIQSVSIPQLTISDEPRFSYRGMMLDVSRHFFPVWFVKKYIDYLALHKFNYFHWHLTDDQGWRIEIKKYPKLTTVGAWRNGTITGHYPGTGNDNLRYGGFYTQEEIKEVVAYAAKRYITIVPEIEMPGHSSAAIAAYPWLSCFSDRPTNIKKSPVSASISASVKKVAETWGVFEDVYCAGNDSTFRFLQDVIDEVIAIFPSRYIHIGGDECPKTHWQQCPKCQERMKMEGLKNEQELQSYFIRRMEKHLNKKGRTVIGWDEILEGGLAPNAVVMSWRGEQGGIEAARQQHEVVMTPNSHLYFDQYQAKASEEPLAIGGYNPLSKVYAYEPVPAVLKDEEAKYIKGVQANLWTEYIKTTEQVEYMVMPRMAALSENAWSPPAQKNWEDFKKRMEAQYRRYEALGINYSKATFDVQQTIVIETAQTRATVNMSTESVSNEIRYTLDGTEPGINSTLYSKPFVIRRSAVIKAVTFKNGKQLGKVSSQQIVLVTRE